MKQHDRDSRELRELCAQRDAARATVRQQAERIAELEARVHTCGPTCSKAGCINRRVTAERDQLRAEVERTGNNRDMWKGQCERQAEQLEQLRAEVDRQTRAMKVIYTWAGVPGALNPEHVRELCGKALGKDSA